MLRLADNLQVDLYKAAGQRVGIIGKSGSGKTNSQVVFVEEWVGAGLPATILDPMAQFVDLPAILPVILAGRGDTAHIEINVKNAAALARLSVEHRVSVILDMSLYSDDEAMDVLEQYLESMWAVIFAQKSPLPYALVIDEAHLYAPQSGVTPLSKTIIDIAKRGRHKRLTTVVATQRAAAITKDFLTQATLLIAHRLSFGVDTAILQEQLPLPKQELNSMMRKLATGEALVIGDAALVGDVDYLRVQVRERLIVADRGEETPVMAGTVGQIADVLRLLAENVPFPDANEVTEIDRLTDEVAGLRDVITEQEHQITRWKAIAALALVGNCMPVKQPRLPITFEVESKQEVLGDENWRSPLSIQRARGQQRKRFDKVLTDIRKMSIPHRALFVWLLEHQGERLNLLKAARRLGYSTTTMMKHPPTRLLETGLMQREYDVDGYEYFVRQSDIAAQFPDLPVSELIDELSGVV
jgi:hypothetical protein